MKPLLDELELVPAEPELFDDPGLLPELEEPDEPELPVDPGLVPPAAATAPPLTGELMLVVVPDEVDV